MESVGEQIRLPCVKGAAPKGLRDWALRVCASANEVKQAAPIPPSAASGCHLPLHKGGFWPLIPRRGAPVARRDPCSETAKQRHPRKGVQRVEDPLAGELRGDNVPSYSSSPFSMAVSMSTRRWWRPPSKGAVSQWVAIILARSMPTTRAPMVRILLLLWRLESSAL